MAAVPPPVVHEEMETDNEPPGMTYIQTFLQYRVHHVVLTVFFFIVDQTADL